MKTMTKLAALAGLALVACSDNDGGVKNTVNATGGGNQTASADPSTPAPVIEAVRCWGLTHGASVFHAAMPERAGDLPVVSTEQSTAWFNEALRRASAAGLNQEQFRALQSEYQMSNRFAMQAELRSQSIEPIKACLASMPTDLSEPPQLPQS